VTASWVAWLVVVFLAQGSWEIMLRSTRPLTTDAARAFFMTVVFGGSMVLSSFSVLAARPRLRRTEWWYGGLAGLCGFIGSGVRPWALRDLDGVIVFPATAVGVMLLVQLAGTTIWKHHLGRWGYLGLAGAVAGVLMMTL